MATEITIPRLGWSMDEGTFVGWLKHDGEAVRAGDPLFSLEGEKSTQDVEAIDDGTLSIPANAPVAGARVAVGSVIGYLLRDGESGPPAPVANERDPGPAIGQGGQPSGYASRATRPSSSPLARRVARQNGIDWTQLRGSGITGRIRKSDVLDAVRAANSRVMPRSTKSDDGDGPAKSLPASPMRRIIAERMAESRRATAPVTLSATANATNLVGLRRQFKAAGCPVSPTSSSSWPRSHCVTIRS
jgi:pyruvate dehydrogenase E2 component (dihydrolipoamide acetyltransferase)